MAWKRATTTSKGLTPLKAIRAKCLDCCCGQWYEVKMCTIDWCPLFEYRFGHNPKSKHKGNVATLDEINKRKAVKERKEKEATNA